MDSLKTKILGSMQSLCSRAEYAPKDVRAKIMRRLTAAQCPDPEPICTEILNSLLADGYLCESRFAAAFAREKAAFTGWGPLKISMALRAKGIGGDAIDAALEGLDMQEAESKLRKLIESKARSLQGDPQIRLKLIRYALSRGYNYSEVESIVRNF